MSAYVFNTVAEARSYLHGLQIDGCTGNVLVTLRHDGNTCPVHEKGEDATRPIPPAKEEA